MSETIVDKIASFIERFVFMQHKPIYRLLALWVIETHFYKEFDYTGSVFIHSPEPESGKTRLMELSHELVANPTAIEVKPTTAVLFRTADGMTQLLDEVDTWENGDSLRAILNAGFQRGAVVTRIEEANNKRKPVPFNVYGPRMLAGIGLDILHRATRDRTFIVPMVRATKNERHEKFRLRKIRPELAALKEEIVEWVADNKDCALAMYEESDTLLFYLNSMRDRTQDIAEPLAAILEAAYNAETPYVLDDRRLEFLEAVSLTRQDATEFVAEHRVLRELKRLANGTGKLVGTASELAAKCQLDPQPNEYEVGHTLKRYGFENKSIRVGQSVRQRYELQKETLADLCARFASSDQA